MGWLLALVGTVTYAKPPNIILILADDLGYGDLGVYGHPYAKTPSINKLARQGTRFTQFYVTGHTCNPSRIGFMTGRYPATFEAALKFIEENRKDPLYVNIWGHLSGYVWTLEGERIAVSQSPYIKMERGEHTLTLEVTDYARRTAKDKVKISVVW